MFSSDLFCFLTYWATAQHPDETRQRFVRMRGVVISGCAARFSADARQFVTCYAFWLLQDSRDLLLGL